ncbi:hypothetical protein V6N13_014933 [Hibiscus sabdariffa]|uniref:Uncharacterized protein n=1 Tax=Hibiscus sabdariffa TaxID=183260 RepID=A0ABR2RWZ9_9ROSI
MGKKIQAAEKKCRSVVAKYQKQRMQPGLQVSKTQMRGVSEEGQRSLGKLGKTTNLGKGGRTLSISVVGKILYKKRVQKAKETLGVRTKETGLESKMRQKELMAASLMAAKRDAAGTESSYRLANMRKKKLMDKLDTALSELVRARAVETLVMQELGFL